MFILYLFLLTVSVKSILEMQWDMMCKENKQTNKQTKKLDINTEQNPLSCCFLWNYIKNVYILFIHVL